MYHYYAKFWHGCPMLNPLCPDDLCQLKAGHRGRHQLISAGGQIETYRLSRLIRIYRGVRPTTFADTAMASHLVARRLWPDQFEQDS